MYNLGWRWASRVHAGERQVVMGVEFTVCLSLADKDASDAVAVYRALDRVSQTAPQINRYLLTKPGARRDPYTLHRSRHHIIVEK